ncbi:hypothetical protein ASPZODRAFT_74669 [Penicilliopsis zonata CBS 506.65]|uniref:Transcription factor TFIIIC triple barrel domain-containing protein n=1 Tax=Penicilliopsis zonata CBS 506.65 TaxID=1073090 RepID=A0A1L9S809_9EURO|nr:hypothetical protein ASPZODRAFT_74669 [Penicilliopsis zonata CBS 506.65]OJJ43299.1 hypothetical protein ASPZODRAFT_74669 [Penicilliopsis zonata CBS 506.65]
MSQLVLDPTMLGGSADGDDSEYEYEYHETETESFYLNLDLTSYHGLIRPPRRRQEGAATAAAAASMQSSRLSSPALEPSSPGGATEDAAPADRVQILGLHTRNPIVSYQNQIFSCSWADMIGTELHFTDPAGVEPPPPPEGEAEGEEGEGEAALRETEYLRRDKKFDLIAGNSVKILGRKANLISSSGADLASAVSVAGAGATPEPASAIAALAGSHLGSATSGPAVMRKTQTQTNQARFLDRLASVKQAKGETDTVRTAFSWKRGQNMEERLRGWARTEEQLVEIQRLNRRALQGDVDALLALEELYMQFERHQEQQED